MPKDVEGCAAPDDPAREAGEGTGMNPAPKQADEVMDLLDRLAHLAVLLETKIEDLSLEEVRLRHDEDNASTEWSVPWNSISHALLWLAVLMLIAREFMT